MAIRNVDHLYAETTHWEESVAMWQDLGFRLMTQWGSEGHRAGRLETGSAAVVLAEVADDVSQAFTVFFGLDDADQFEPGPNVDVETPLEPTHWGTRWIRVRDPEGRLFALEEMPPDEEPG